ncbi:hypothetical protein [Fictibacillus fluitans]|uniref:hypothetical protein n=1 Tax=Fictibacillus fluitans TaxID=3058422 RepID=UPI0033BFA37B
MRFEKFLMFLFNKQGYYIIRVMSYTYEGDPIFHAYNLMKRSFNINKVLIIHCKGVRLPSHNHHRNLIILFK